MQTRPEDLLLAEKITDKITSNIATTAFDDEAAANLEAVRKSLLFGLCQFAMRKIFNNEGKPYSADDDDNKNRFSSACWEALGNRNVGTMDDEYDRKK